MKILIKTKLFCVNGSAPQFLMPPTFPTAESLAALVIFK